MYEYLAKAKLVYNDYHPPDKSGGNSFGDKTFGGIHSEANHPESIHPEVIHPEVNYSVAMHQEVSQPEGILNSMWLHPHADNL